MSARGPLYFKLVLSVFVAFAVSMAFSWFLHNTLSERDARRLIDHAFDDVSADIVERVNERLVRQCMAARERLEDGYPTDTASLQRLARELRVTEVCVADEKGDIIHSSEPDYLAHDGKPAFNFAAAGGQAAEMMRLVNSDATEYCQSFRENSANGVWRKYVGVWKPTGGFVEIGCDGESLRSLSRSSLVGLSRNWHVGGTGGIVLTTVAGLVLSDYLVPGREGTQWVVPDDTFYWQRRDIDSFPVYVMIPKSAAAVQRDVLVGATALLNGLALVCVALLVGFVIAAFVRRQLREQSEKELRMATEIQLSAMPNVFPPFPDELSFEVFASMKTAKEVGGDFYDFYFSAPKTLTFVVADVSGKGVPAAMFMMRAKTLLKGAAQTGKPIAQVVAETNDALCEGNEANMFVTAWIGELHVDTGLLTYVNAGHNPPVLRHGGEVAYLRSRPGLVLGAMAGIPYRAIDVQLQPGDGLYLYTDGITEQPNAAGELFGEERLLKLLEAGRNKAPKLLDDVLAAVKNHADETEQADDCTQLVLRFRGPAEVVEHTYAPTMEDLAKATADLEAALEMVPMKQQMTLMVAADEIFANIVRHSGATRWSLRVERPHHPESVRLVFIDDGKPFDPLRQRDPDTTLDAEARKVGGLGILIVKKTMSPVAYSRKHGRNVLTMGLDYGA